MEDHEQQRILFGSIHLSSLFHYPSLPHSFLLSPSLTKTHREIAPDITATTEVELFHRAAVGLKSLKEDKARERRGTGEGGKKRKG